MTQKFSKEDQEKFLNIYLEDEFKLVDYLSEHYAWFKDLNKEAMGLENLDIVFDLSPKEIEACVDQNIETFLKIKSKEGVSEFRTTDDGFEHIDFERGQAGTPRLFKAKDEFVKYFCWCFVSMIPRYSNTWNFYQ